MYKIIKLYKTVVLKIKMSQPLLLEATSHPPKFNPYADSQGKAVKAVHNQLTC